MSMAQVIANYESLRELTGQMRDAALRGDWDPLIDIGQKRSSLVEALKPLDAEAVLDEATSRRKDELITEILGYDAEIRGAVQSWISQFQADMQSSRQELRLLKEYGL
jgi:hypothetical protein